MKNHIPPLYHLSPASLARYAYRAAKPAAPIVPLPPARPILTHDEKKIILPKLRKGKPILGKNGKPETFLLMLVTRTVCGAGAEFSVTSRSSAVTADHFGRKTKISLHEFRRVCERTFGEDAERAFHHLSDLITARRPDYSVMSAAELESLIYKPAPAPAAPPRPAPAPAAPAPRVARRPRAFDSSRTFMGLGRCPA